MMARALARLGAALVYAACAARALDDGQARVPPMGWNSDNYFGDDFPNFCRCDGVVAPKVRPAWLDKFCMCDCESCPKTGPPHGPGHHYRMTEGAIRAMADVMVSSGMKAAGYEYINLDDCWQSWNRSATTGRLFANQSNFPSGMKSTVDYVHQKGLKFGIYSTRCNLTCARRASSYGHYPLDAETFASWGVDYLKFDDCPGCPHGADPKTLLKAMRDELNITGRKIVYSTELFSADPSTRDINHLTRVGTDVRANFKSILGEVDASARFASVASPGYFNDMDCLEVGMKHDTGSGMSPVEERTHMALWSMFSSPLMAGNDLRQMDKQTLEILTWRQAIAINQDVLGIQATQCNAAPAGGGLPFERFDAVVTKDSLGCDGSAQQNWALSTLATNATVTVKQKSSGLCLGVVSNGRDCESQVTTMACIAKGAAWRRFQQRNSTQFSLMSELNGQPLNLFESPLDTGRFKLDVQTCKGASQGDGVPANNLWVFDACLPADGGIMPPCLTSAVTKGCVYTGNISITPDQPPPISAEGDSSVYSKLLNDGSTAMLFVNRNDSRTLNVSASLSECLGAGYAAGTTLAAIDLRDDSPLPPVEASGNVSFVVGPHDHRLIMLTPKVFKRVMQTSTTPYLFLRCPGGRKIAPSGITAACGSRAGKAVDVSAATKHCAGRQSCGVGAGLGPAGSKLPACSLLFVEYDCAPEHSGLKSDDASARATLPAPLRLMVEHLQAPLAPNVLVVDTARPRFAFVPHAADQHPGAGVEMTAFRIVVSEDGAEGNAAPAWDSGVVNESAVVGVKCGSDLKTLSAYTWSAQWWSSTSASPSPKSTSKFELGPSEKDWASSQWLGAPTQKEFKLTFTKPDAKAKVRLYVAAAGGSVVHGLSDVAGISARTDFSAFVPYQSYNAASLGGGGEIVVAIGEGFSVSCTFPVCGLQIGSCNSLSDCAAHVGGVTPFAVGKALLRVDGKPAPGLSVKGRRGRVIESNPFVGGIYDHRVTGNGTFAALIPVPGAGSPGTNSTPQGRFRALAMPLAVTSPQNADEMNLVPTVLHVKPWHVVGDGAGASSSTAGSQWLYKMSRNIVGAAIVDAGAYSGTGNLTLQYCEVLNGTRCMCLRRLCSVIDTFNVDHSTAGSLQPSFTWHGYQYVIVTATDSIKFDAKAASLKPAWTANELEQSAKISFVGEGAKQLGQIRDITKASQLSNMNAYVPTDCPTREKHSWTGDTSVTAEEGMYNYFNPMVYELFLDTCRAGQGKHGNIAMAVPTSREKQDYATDVSWSSGYPQVSAWLIKYFGDTAIVKDHWKALKMYMDGQILQWSSVPPAASCIVPSFSQCGDWCAIENRSISTKGTGPPAAAANYILSVQAMVDMAEAIGKDADAQRYKAQLAPFKKAFHKRYFVAATGSYSNRSLEVQALSSIALGADAVPKYLRATVLGQGFVDDITKRGYHAVGGSTAAKWVLPQLSANGEHDVALKLAAQTTYPSFGWWLSQGATTCWESWSGVQDGSHPGTPQSAPLWGGGGPNNPTHNHIFLCGGAGEWMYHSLGGIAPASAGYATVTIAPKISKTLGPSSVAASVQTVRGLVKSNWTRHEKGSRCFVQLAVSVPVGMHATIDLPLLGRAPGAVAVEEVEVAHGALWRDGAATGRAASLGWLRAPPRAAAEAGGGHVLRLETAAGEFTLRGCDEN